LNIKSFQNNQNKFIKRIDNKRFKNDLNKARKEKAWKYALIPHDKTDTNMTFMKLVTEYGK
jgi:hypothetical protein